MEDMERVLQERPVAFSSLPIGLYRASGTRGSELGYVVTAPPPDFKLQASDKLFTLATPPFAHLFTRLEELSDVIYTSNMPCLAKHLHAAEAQLANVVEKANSHGLYTMGDVTSTAVTRLPPLQSSPDIHSSTESVQMAPFDSHSANLPGIPGD